MKTYIKVVALIVTTTFTYFFLVPNLISMPNSFAALGGLIIAVLMPAAIYKLYKRLFTVRKEK
ncbi:hypothetical protein [Serratia quinivorans]|uniref:hypothetical protein n=1 Tax=Serratia quinivorans TaxID=137545 RepID=UPI00217A4D0C|nr:hypothetical protein [Serratia quinivorans]CAI1110883.1 Uncharacterised protein [Serratia quinivorans]